MAREVEAVFVRYITAGQLVVQTAIDNRSSLRSYKDSMHGLNFPCQGDGEKMRQTTPQIAQFQCTDAAPFAHVDRKVSVMITCLNALSYSTVHYNATSTLVDITQDT